MSLSSPLVIRTVVLLFVFASTSTVSAFQVTNGSFVGNRGANRVASGWTIPGDGFSSPDLNQVDGNLTTTGSAFDWDGTVLDSPDGGQWANLFGFRFASGEVRQEGISQIVSGLQLGVEYSIDFEYAVQPITNGNSTPITSGGVDLTLTDSVGGNVGSFQTAEDQTAFTWEDAAFSFVATDSQIQFELRSLFSEGNATYVGVDGFSVTAVPEPSGMALLAMVTAFGLVRRRRR